MQLIGPDTERANLDAQGKLSEAEPFFCEALEVSRWVLGDEHPRNLSPLRTQHGALLRLDRVETTRTLPTGFFATTDLPEDHALCIEIRGLLEAMVSPSSDDEDERLPPALA